MSIQEPSITLRFFLINNQQFRLASDGVLSYEMPKKSQATRPETN